jgi:Nif-specific regulatory protein
MAAQISHPPEHHSSKSRHERELDALALIAQGLSSRSGQRQMLEEVLAILEEHLAMSRGTIMLLSPDGLELVVEAASRLPDPERPDLRYQKGEGITGRVLQTGLPAIIPNILHEPDFQNRIHRRDHQDLGPLSFICVPIALGAQVIGTLSVDIALEDSPALTQTQRLLGIVASMIANELMSRRLAKLERQRLEAENQRLRSNLQEHFQPGHIVGNSASMRLVYTRIHQVAFADTTVLVRGETGTGKELVASAIHYSSPRAEKPFVKVNCAALNENLLESELFGHEKGAFTGASMQRVGRVEEAHGGTLFLDEIGEISLSTQSKLLRVLQEREFERVGSNKSQKVDIRLIVATNRDLEAAVAAKTFREDLYYRIQVFPIHLPPLRERRDDILLLADHFAEKYGQQMNKPVRRISTSAINMMFAYHWPGNVRELENCIQHAVLLSEEGVIHGNNLPPTLQTPDNTDVPATGSLPTRVAVLEKDMIIDALKRAHGSIPAAARDLGITNRIIRYKIKKLNIDYPRLFKSAK